MELEDGTPQQGTCGRFCAKYFCEGQKLEKDYEAKLKAGRVDWTVRGSVETQSPWSSTSVDEQRTGQMAEAIGNVHPVLLSAPGLVDGHDPLEQFSQVHRQGRPDGQVQGHGWPLGQVPALQGAAVVRSLAWEHS